MWSTLTPTSMQRAFPCPLTKSCWFASQSLHFLKKAPDSLKCLAGVSVPVVCQCLALCSQEGLQVFSCTVFLKTLFFLFSQYCVGWVGFNTTCHLRWLQMSSPFLSLSARFPSREGTQGPGLQLNRKVYPWGSTLKTVGVPHTGR